MDLLKLGTDDIDEVLDLFCDCFEDDSYYSKIFNSKDKLQKMREVCRPSIEYCLGYGYCIGVREKGKLIAFFIGFDYKKTKAEHDDMFYSIFTGDKGKRELPYADSLHGELDKIKGDVLFGVSVAVSSEWRRCGLAAALIDTAIKDNSDAYLVSDVSNSDSLSIYKSRGFDIKELDRDYYLIVRLPNTNVSICFDDMINLIVADLEMLSQNEIKFDIIKEKYYVFGCKAYRDEYALCFRAEEMSIAEGVKVSLEYRELLKYQRLINVSQFAECIVGESLCYVQKEAYSETLLMNDTLAQMIACRKNEWNVIADVFASVPVKYDRDILMSNLGLRSDDKSEVLLENLNFRTHYEAGIPDSSAHIDDLTYYKNRIERHYLGKVKIQICCESTADDYKQSPTPIGAAAVVDLYISIDCDSECAVLTWYSLSAPFLISQLMDNVIRNQLSVIWAGEQMNFFDFLYQEYGLVKRGTSKIFVMVPQNKECLEPSQRASLLACETIYPDGEKFGKIIDSEIVDIISSEKGMGQYDRAFVCAYTNTVLQFSAGFVGTLSDRLSEEAITLFYMELILMEEAAIHIADRKITKLLTSEDLSDPIEFLRRVDAVNDEYSRTIDFWDVEVNYPTSQKSVNMLRHAFKIKEQLEYMQRNQNQLTVSFDTKREIIDRRDSKRTESSLAILSVLAVFSAWMDSHDYLSTWSEVIGTDVTELLQRILFALIFLVAVYVVYGLFHKKDSSKQKAKKKAGEKGKIKNKKPKRRC